MKTKHLPSIFLGAWILWGHAMGKTVLEEHWERLGVFESRERCEEVAKVAVEKSVEEQRGKGIWITYTPGTNFYKVDKTGTIFSFPCQPE